MYSQSEDCAWLQVCTKYPHCDRKICFFAHGEDQLRQPDLSYGFTSVAEAVSHSRWPIWKAIFRGMGLKDLSSCWRNVDDQVKDSMTDSHISRF